MFECQWIDVDERLVPGILRVMREVWVTPREVAPDPTRNFENAKFRDLTPVNS